MHASDSSRILPRLVLLALIAGAPGAAGRDHRVSDSDTLRAVSRRLKPGDRVLLAPRVFAGDLHLSRVRGTAQAPIVMESAHPERRPVFRRGKQGLRLSDCAYLTLRGLGVEDCTAAGIVVGDGESFDTPSHHIVLEDLSISEIGPEGDRDALRLAGVTDFVVRRSRFEAWGGSAIDVVGCRRGVIEDCEFTGREGFDTQRGVRIRGGSSNILLRASFFRWAGYEVVGIGGKTPAGSFRAPGATTEAAHVEVAGNRILGGSIPITWNTAQGGRVHHNTILMPLGWIVRIAQENDAEAMLPCANGRFDRNLVVYGRRAPLFISTGENMLPRTFVFGSNAWYAVQGSSKPRLPIPETDGVYGVDPKVSMLRNSEYRRQSDDPRLKDIGADAYRPRPPAWER